MCFSFISIASARYHHIVYEIHPNKHGDKSRDKQGIISNVFLLTLRRLQHYSFKKSMRKITIAVPSITLKVSKILTSHSCLSRSLL